MPHPDRRAFQSRRRGFDDDQPPTRGETRDPFARREAPAMPSTGPVKEATVKWFNREKGFGFVQLADGTGEVFLHSSVLRRLGYDAVGDGASLQVRTGQGQKGLQVSEVISVDESTVSERPASSRPMGGGGMGGAAPRFGGGAVASGPTGEMTGKVKWFNSIKGFGFIQSDQGGKDIFIHVSTLERAGLKSLNENQAVRVQVRQGAKGPEAAELSLL